MRNISISTSSAIQNGFSLSLSLSAMHIYVSALPLLPRDSAIYKHYGEGLIYVRMATTYHEKEWFQAKYG